VTGSSATTNPLTPAIRTRQHISRRILTVLSFIALGLGVSAGAGWLAAMSQLGAPQITAIVYASGASEAEFFYSDPFGNIIPDQVATLPIKMGINTLTFDVSDESARASYLQRFDPCRCDQPVLVGSLRLETPLYFESLAPSSWVPSGDTAAVVIEGSAARLVMTPGATDPQLTLYADISSFAKRAEAVAFWSVFGLSGALIMLFVGIAAVLLGLRRAGTGMSGKYLFSRRSISKEPKIPLALGVFLALVGAIAVGQQIAGAWVTGVTIDEPAHVRHLANYFDSGSYSSSVYGPVTSLFGHVLNVLLGHELWGLPLATAEAYQGRHLAVALIGALGLVAVGMGAWIVFGSSRWALLGVAVLGSIPLWVGHSMFNIKDVPLATGYAMVTAGLIAALSNDLGGWRKSVAVFAPLSIGVFIGAGTRPGALALMAGSAVVAALLWFLFHSRIGTLTRRLVVAGVSMGAFALVVAATLLFTEVGAGLLAGIERSLDFPWTGLNLYAGELVDERPGVAVIAMVFASSLPLFILCLVVAGAVLGVTRLVQGVRSGGFWSLQESAFVLVSAQAVVGLVAVAVVNPTIYDGGRQLLFAFPAFALLGVYGVYALFKALPYVVSSGRFGRRILLTIIVVGFSLITIEQLRFFPYNYSYYNEIAQGPGVTGRWETDYWASSIREGARFVAPDDPAMCGVIGAPNFDSGRSIPNPCSLLAPYAAGFADAANSVLNPQEFWIIRSDRTLINHGPVRSDACRLHHEVTRPLRGEDVVMSRVYICLDK
jgi:hypothetical protein